MSNPESTLKVRQLFSDTEYLDVSQLIKISKTIAILYRDKDHKEEAIFIAIDNLKALDQDLQRIDLSQAIHKYQALEYEGEIFQILDPNSVEFTDKLMEVFTENV